MALPPVSIITVTRDGLFFTRLLVDQVRRLVGPRDYEIIVVDQGSRDGTQAWLRAQPDVRLLRRWTWFGHGHRHGEAAEKAVRAARHERIVLLDSDAHPVSADWLENSADLLDDARPIAGAIFRSPHRGNPHGWYVHPHFMAFRRSDLGGLVVLRKLRGEDTDTGEEATIRVLAAGRGVIGHEIAFCPELSVGHERVPTVAGGVFHCWYTSRLLHEEAVVLRESEGQVSRATYLDPLMAKLRAHYGLDY
ncbi:glycosyltransferase family 2 protein [Roseomonas sp. AR75]|uniref:glycosyltransferase family 2 protein n=1 Tax=Roseomonas sp. AR75 TaxID=2562311 RepID=UPI0010C00221|nr:glycosyltransferase [Roseomonas sp. AR75]